MSEFVWPHGLQHTKHSFPSPFPRACSNSWPLSGWCHPTISSSVIPFFSCPQSLPASESFPMSQLFAWGGQNTGVSVSASFLPKKSQGWSPLGWTGWISLQSKGLSRVFSNTTVQKHQFGAQLSSQSNSHIHTWPLDYLRPNELPEVPGACIHDQSLSRVWLFVTPWTAPRQASLSNTNSQSLLKLMSIKLVMSSNYLILCYSLLLLPSIFPSIRVFSCESVLCIRWPKYWSFSFNISPSNEYSGLISFRMDWLDLLAVQGTLKSLLQHHSSKASILLYSAFFTVQLSHPYMTAGKTTALTRWTFVGKIMSLLFNMLSRLVKTFLPRSKYLLISWLKSPSAVILEPQK